jgi:hypothetical protein
MKTINQTAKTQELDNKAIYRAPRLVALGAAEDLVQYSSFGRMFDSSVGNGRTDSRY